MTAPNSDCSGAPRRCKLRCSMATPSGSEPLSSRSRGSQCRRRASGIGQWLALLLARRWWAHCRARGALRCVPVSIVVGDAGRRYPPLVESTAWFVACEAVANSMKHASPSTVEVRLDDGDGELRVVIVDNGCGGAVPRGSGLRGLADRVEAAGGRLIVEAEVPVGTSGGGPAVRVVVADDAVLWREALLGFSPRQVPKSALCGRLRGPAECCGATPAGCRTRRCPHAPDVHPRRSGGSEGDAGEVADSRHRAPLADVGRPVRRSPRRANPAVSGTS